MPLLPVAPAKPAGSKEFFFIGGNLPIPPNPFGCSFLLIDKHTIPPLKILFIYQ
jgi:hypothetical protein